MHPSPIWWKSAHFFSVCQGERCFCQIAEHPDAMATALVAKLLKNRRQGKDARSFFLPRQTCVVAAELSRGHHTRRLCSDLQKSTLPPSLFYALSIFLSPPLTCQFLCRQPMTNSHQSLNLSASMAESMGCPWSRG